MTKLTNEALSLAANTIRCLSIDGIQAAKSGHPGLPLGMADVAALVWLKYLKHDPTCPDWADRDRFVLSGGHGSMLLYSLLHLSGYGLDIEELKKFRQFGSRTPGHPEYGHTKGVETTTGPLGQGIATAVGMALAERMLAARINKAEGEFQPVDHRTYVFCGDGDLMEGISHEACSLAGHLALDKIVMFYDSNNITIEGKMDLACSDNVKQRFLSYNWNVLEADGHDFDSIDKAVKKALRLTGKPCIIICKTTIGKGSPNKAGTSSCHGAPLGDDEVKLTKQALGFDPEKFFYVPDEVRDLFAERTSKLHRMQLRWTRLFKEWKKANPELAVAWQRHVGGELPENLESFLPVFDPAKPVATRSASGQVLNALAAAVPQLIGGSADLAPSNMTNIKDGGDIGPADFAARNIHFGIRELAMSSIMSGMLLHGGFRVFGGTFFVFSDYCRPAMRVAALMKLPVIFIFSHDSFYVGEDGPTHQPIEQLAAIRCMPGVTSFRPADPTETAAAWIAALKHKDGPVALLLTRQNMKVIDRNECAPASELEKGAYTLWQTRAGKPDLMIIATGSEVELALDAAKQVPYKNVRVVSMPSRELFDRQPQKYRDSVIDPACTKRLVVEAGCSFGWHRYAGPNGKMITIDHFGASGPYKTLAKEFGFTVENVLAAALSL